MPIYQIDGLTPVVPEESYVHPTAVLIGDVILGKGVYVGPNASLRGDFGRIVVKDGANIQDNCVMHGFPFNTGEAVHFFCSVCGIYTFHQRRSNPQQYGVNVACIDGVSPFDFPCVEVNDGVNHPKDGGGGVVGYLRYEKK